MLIALSSAFSVRKHCFDVTPTPRGEWFHIQTCLKWSFNSEESERFEIRGGYPVFLDACSQTLMACGAHVLWVRCIQWKHIPFSRNTFVIFCGHRWYDISDFWKFDSIPFKFNKLCGTKLLHNIELVFCDLCIIWI